MSCIVSMVKMTITLVICSAVVGCSTGPNQPSSDLVPVNRSVAIPGTAVDKAQWDILERIAVGQDFTVDGLSFRKIDDYYSARKSRCFRVVRMNETVPEREYQVLCHDQEDPSSWYLANQVLANETGVSHD